MTKNTIFKGFHYFYLIIVSMFSIKFIQLVKSMVFRISFFLFFICFSLLNSQAQMGELREDFQTKFDKLTTKDGLSDNEILDIIQDRYGFIWVATADGLNRYDGYEFLVFKNIPTDSTSISSNFITSITEDIYGDLWIGTAFGLNKYDRTKDVFIHYFSDQNSHKGLQNNHIRKILADEKGILWIETVEGHLHKFSIRSNQMKHYKHRKIYQEYYHYHTLFKENDSILWVGGRGLNVHRFNINTEEFKIFHSKESGGKYKKRSNDVSFYFLDSRDQFWVCGLDGVYKFDRELNEFDHLMGGSTYHIYEDRNKVLWFGKGNGIVKYDPEKEEYTHVSADVNNPNALSNNHVNKIMEDMSGVVWVATNNGLNLYSPKKHNFTHHFHIPDEKRSISGRKVTALAEEENGVLWVGTNNEGLNAFDFKKGVIGEYKRDHTAQSLLSNKISHLYLDKSENLWISQWAGLGIDKLDIGRNTLKPFTINKTNTYVDWYHQIIEEGNGNMLLAVWGGYGLYEIKEKNSEIHNIGAKMIVSPNERYVSTITIDLDSLVWFGGVNGQLDVLVIGKREMVHLKNLFPDDRPNYRDLQKMQAYNYINMNVPYFDTINQVLITKDQVYFANRTGLFAYDKELLKFHSDFPDVIKDQVILSMAKSKDEVLFLLQNSLAILNLTSQEWRIENFKTQEAPKAQILVSPNRLWISKGANLYQFNRKFQIIDSSKYNHAIVDLQNIEEDKVVFAVGSEIIVKGNSEDKVELGNNIKGFIWEEDRIIYLSDHMLWNAQVQNSGKIIAQELLNKTRPNTDLKSLKFHALKRNGNSIFVASNKGYINYNERNGTAYFTREKENSFMNYPVHLLTSISKAKNKEYWLGTTSTGMAKWNSETNKIKNYNSNEFEEDAYWGNSVDFIFKDSKGRSWSGSRGLNLYSDSIDGFLHYTTEHGLASNKVKGMAEDDDGKLWMTTDKGLSSFSIPEQSFRNYTSADGLPYGEPTSAIIKLNDGRITFGIDNGFVVFHPDSLHANNYIPPVVITEFRIQDNQVFRDLSELDTVIINPKENHISFRFAALDYNSPSDNKYQYKLEGVDQNWIQTNSKNRAISYSNLEPGEYVFMLKGSNNNRVWNEFGKSITVLILPRFYQQWWFYVLISLFLIFIIVMIVLYRIRELKLQNKAASLEQRFLRSQMNPHFIFNSLGAIQNFIFKNEPIVAATYLSNFSDLVRMILNNSRQDLITLQTEIKTLNQYLDLQVLRFGDKFDFEIEKDENLDLENIFIPPMLAQPFIENSIEHGFKGLKYKGLIKVCFRSIDGKLAMICQDNGMGINASIKEKELKKKKYKSLATKITKDRIAVLNKVHKSKIQIEISDMNDIYDRGHGTRVEIKLPMNLKKEES